MNIASRDEQPQGSPPWSDQRITAFVLGELDAEEAARFEREIGDQPALASAVEEARQLTEQLRSWYAAEPAPQLDAPRRQRLLSAMAQAPTYRPLQHPPAPQAPPKPQTTSASAAPGGWQRHGTRVRWLALAATLLIAIGGLTYQFGDRGEGMRPVALAPREPDGDAASSEPSGDDAAASAPLAESLQAPQAAPERAAGDASLMQPQRFQGDAAAPQAVPQQRFAEGQTLEASPRTRRAAPPPAAKAEGADSPGAAASSPRRFAADDPAVLGVDAAQAERSAAVPPQRTALPPPMMMRAAAPQAAEAATSSLSEPPFQAVSEQPHSRIPTEVDLNAAAMLREALAQGRLPRPEEVRIGSLINALSSLGTEQRLPVEIEIGPCPWRPEHRLARIAIQRTADDDDSSVGPGERATDFYVVFNPAQVASYRVIGFEDRSPGAEEAADDSQPSGDAQAEAATPQRTSALVLSAPEDSGREHRLRQVIVLYQWVPQRPSGNSADAGEPPRESGERPRASAGANPVLTVQLRRGGDEAAVLAEYPATVSATERVGPGSVPYRTTALIAALGLQLRQSEFRGNWTLQDVLQEAHQLAAEFDTSPPWLELVQQAATLQAGQTADQQQ